MKFIKNLTLFLIMAFCTLTAIAQTTTFTYQGKLTDNGTPQSIYEMQFKLFGSVGGSDQIGGTITNPNVSVNQGVFTVNLDFGAAAFPGADRYLEISVRRNSGESFVTLNPRQQIASSPYSIRTLSAAQADISLDSNKLGGIAASEYVTTTSVGNSFIKNDSTQQTGNFNISGNGVVGGRFGIGTQTPQAKFHAAGGSSWFQGDSTPLPAAAGKGIVVGFAGEHGYIAAFDYGTFTPKNLLLNNPGGNVGIGTTAPLGKLHVAGNTVQDRDKGGMVKAMLSVSSDGTIERCYNGVIGTSTQNCGFTIAAGSNGIYTIDLGFRVTDRFLSVTARGINGSINLPPSPMSADFRFSSLPNSNPNEVTIDTFRSDTRQTINNPFMLIVY